MPGEMMLAVIAALTSLLVALISLIASVLSSRQSTKAARQLEEMRHSFEMEREREKEREANRLQRLQVQLESSKASSRAIQNMKNEVQLVLSAVATSLDSASALAGIASSRKALFKVYEDTHVDLAEQERDVLHNAKNLTLKVEEVLTEALGKVPYASEIPDEVRQSVVQLRNELTECQRFLLDSRLELALDNRGGDAARLEVS